MADPWLLLPVLDPPLCIDPVCPPTLPPEEPPLALDPDALPVAVVEALELTAVFCCDGETLGRSY
jgi:hypothetical protein